MLADQINALRQDSLAALDASHDYYAHTTRAWRIIQKLAQRGHKITIRNRMTGTTVNERQLPRLGQNYVAHYLASAAFQHFVSLFEDFIFDFLRAWLIEYPGSLSDKQLEFRTVLECGDRTEIVRAVVEKELAGLRYDRLENWFKRLERLAKLGCPTQEQIEQLSEMKGARDVLVHNKGIANRLYVEKSMGRARFKAGQKITIPAQYLHQSWRLIRQIVVDSVDAAARKFGT